MTYNWYKDWDKELSDDYLGGTKRTRGKSTSLNEANWAKLSFKFFLFLMFKSFGFFFNFQPFVRFESINWAKESKETNKIYTQAALCASRCHSALWELRPVYTLRKTVLPSTYFWCFRLSQIEDSGQYLNGPNAQWSIEQFTLAFWAAITALDSKISNWIVKLIAVELVPYLSMK